MFPVSCDIVEMIVSLELLRLILLRRIFDVS